MFAVFIVFGICVEQKLIKLKSRITCIRRGYRVSIKLRIMKSFVFVSSSSCRSCHHDLYVKNIHFMFEWIRTSNAIYDQSTAVKGKLCTWSDEVFDEQLDFSSCVLFLLLQSCFSVSSLWDIFRKRNTFWYSILARCKSACQFIKLLTTVAPTTQNYTTQTPRYCLVHFVSRYQFAYKNFLQ